MYPSLEKETIRKELFKVVMESEVRISNIDWETLSIFVLHNTTSDRLKKLGLLPVMPSKVTGKKKEMKKENYQWRREPNQLHN